MKLMIAILRDNDSDKVCQALIEAGFRITRIASTGGFLRRGQTTFMVGVEDERLDQAIELMRSNCSPTMDPSMRGATLFVLNVERFTQI